jgi:hypothetical protein
MKRQRRLLAIARVSLLGGLVPVLASCKTAPEPTLLNPEDGVYVRTWESPGHEEFTHSSLEDILEKRQLSMEVRRPAFREMHYDEARFQENEWKPRFTLAGFLKWVVIELVCTVLFLPFVLFADFVSLLTVGMPALMPYVLDEQPSPIGEFKVLQNFTIDLYDGTRPAANVWCEIEARAFDGKHSRRARTWTGTTALDGTWRVDVEELPRLLGPEEEELRLTFTLVRNLQGQSPETVTLSASEVRKLRPR